MGLKNIINLSYVPSEAQKTEAKTAITLDQTQAITFEGQLTYGAPATTYQIDIQGSIDGVTWVILDSMTWTGVTTSSNKYVHLSILAATSAKPWMPYLRANCTSTAGGSTIKIIFFDCKDVNYLVY